MLADTSLRNELEPMLGFYFTPFALLDVAVLQIPKTKFLLFYLRSLSTSILVPQYDLSKLVDYSKLASKVLADVVTF